MLHSAAADQPTNGSFENVQRFSLQRLGKYFFALAVLGAALSLTGPSSATTEPYEAGLISLSGEWQTVVFVGSFVDPVVVAGPASRNEIDPGVVEIANVGPSSFDIRFREWAYLDGTHVVEQVSYLAVERGTTTLDAGIKIEAGTASLGGGWNRTWYDSSFLGSNPSLLLTVADNTNGPVAPRVRNVTRSRFDVRQWVEEGSSFQPTTTVNWVAWATGSAAPADGQAWETGNARVDEVPEVVGYDQTYTSPCLLADINSPTSNPVTVRALNVGGSSATLISTEEQAADVETVLGDETVRYLIIECDSGPDVTLPDWAPEVQLQTSNLTPDSVTLDWTPGATDNVGITAYVVFQDGQEIGTVAGDQTTFAVTGLTPETDYDFTVQAEDAAGNQSTTGPTVTITTPPPPDVTPPAWAPEVQLQTSNLTPTSVTLDWTPGATDNTAVTNYLIFQDGQEIGTVADNQTTFAVTGLDAETDYDFTIEAEDAAANQSTTGPTVTITTPPPPDTTPPDWAPEVQLQTSNLTPDSVTLDWTPGATDNVGITAYVVFQDGQEIGTVAGDQTTFAVTGLTPETDYDFAVEAEDAATNQSTTGPTVTVTTPAPPDTTPPDWAPEVQLQATNLTPDSVTLDWTPGATDNTAVTNYLIFQDGQEIGTVADNQTTFAVTGLDAETDYDFTIEAEDAAANQSTTGPTVTITTPPPPDTTPPDWAPEVQLQTSNLTPDSVTLDWTPGATDNVEVTGYVVFQDGQEIGTVADDQTTYAVTGLDPETDYDFTVQAEDAAANQSTTGPTVTITTPPPPDVTPPAWAPEVQLQTSNLTPTSVTLDWTPGATDNTAVTNYLIFQDGQQIATLADDQTTFNITGLDPETDYDFTIEAEDAAGNQTTNGPTVTITTPAPPDTTPPDWAPEVQLQTSNLTPDSVTLDWAPGATDNTAVTNYLIFQDGQQIATVADDQTTFNITGLTPETDYDFTVQAEDAAGNQSTTGPTVTITTPAPPDTTPPDWAPEVQLQTSNLTPDSVTLDWAPGATDNTAVTNYLIFQDGQQVATVADDQTTFNITGLDAETDYDFTIEAEDAAGNQSTTGPTVTVTTPAPPDTTPPAWAPEVQLQATNLTAQTVTLDWTPGATDNTAVTNYLIFQDGQQMATVADDQTTFNITGLDPETDYDFTVQAEDPAGNQSTTGPTVTITTPAPPDTTPPAWAPEVQLQTSNLTPDSVTLDWTPGATDNTAVTNYLIFQDGQQMATVADDQTTFNITGLDPETDYDFTVQAEDAAGNQSTTGPAVTITTPPDTTSPSWGAVELQATNVTTQTVTLDWAPGATDNIAVTNYLVLQDGQQVATVAEDQTTFNITGLTPETDYDFTVQAEDAAGNQSSVGPITVTTAQDQTPPVWAPEVELVATNLTAQTVTLDWTPGATDNSAVTNYLIFQDGQQIATVAGDQTTYTVTGLDPDTDYDFTVQAEDAATNQSTGGPMLTATTPSDSTAPTWAPEVELQATNLTTQTLTLDWTPGATDNIAVTNYLIFQDGQQIATLADDQTTYAVTGLDPDTDYDFTVQAEDAATNQSTTGPTLTITTAQDSTPPDWAPEVALLASSLTPTSVTLDWTPGATDNIAVTGYLIFQDGQQIATLADDQTTYAVTGLAPETDYDFTVQAEDAAANQTTNGPTVTVTTPQDTTPPDWAPEVELQATNLTSDSVTLDWTPGASDDIAVTNYLVFQDGQQIATVADDQTTFNVTGLDPDTDYDFAVEAEDAATNQSTTGPAVTVTTPAPPDTTPPDWAPEVELLATNLTLSGVTLDWTPGATDNIAVTSYLVFQDGQQIATLADDQTTYAVTGLDPDTDYDFAVEAEDAAGNQTTNGPTVTVTTPPDTTPPDWAPEVELLATNLTSDSVTLDWAPGATDDIAVTNYLVFQDGQQIATVAEDQTTHTVTGLDPETDYDFAVEAEDAAANQSTGGPMLTVTTPSDSTAPTWAPEVELQATNLTAQTLTLDWTPGATDNIAVTNYLIFQDGQQIATLADDQTTFNVTGLDPDTDYDFTVQAEDAAANQSTTGPTLTVTTLPDTTPPDWAPEVELLATNLTPNSVTLDWTPGATDDIAVINYLVFQDGQQVATVAGDQTTHAVSGLTPETDYDFTIEAEDAAANQSTTGPTLTVTTPPDTTPPDWAPEVELQTSDLTPTSVTLDWTPGATDNIAVTNYLIFQDGQQIATVTGDQTTHTVEGLDPETDYDFTIQAEDGAANQSTNGPILTVTTPPDTTPPDWAPEVELQTSDLTPTSVTLDWTPGATDNIAVTNYLVFQDGQQIATLADDQTTHTVEGLDPDTDYDFTVQAEDAASNQSTTGPTATVTTPAPPDTTPPTWAPEVNIQTTDLAARSVTLDWAPGATDNIAVTNYLIFQDGQQIATVTGDQTSHSVEGLDPETDYDFTVQAEDAAANQSTTGPTLTVTTPPDTTPPTWGASGLSLDFLGATWINLRWAPGADDASGGVTYQVLRDGVVETTTSDLTFTVQNLSPSTTYDFQVIASDPNGNASAPLQASATTANLGNGSPIESGSVEITSSWTTVTINNTFNDPVVVVGPTTEQDTDPGFAIIDNVTPGSFDIRFKEWDYLDDSHGTETVSYLIAERGVTTLASGTIIEAGTVLTRSSSQTQNFVSNFGARPAMVVAAVGDTGPFAVTQRLRAITGTKFIHRYFVQESDSDNTLRPFNWLAWQRGDGNAQDGFEWVTSQQSTDENYSLYSFGTTFDNPCVYGEVYSNLPQPASIRRDALAPHQVDLRIAEEQSEDSETNLANEGIVLLAMECNNTVSAGDQSAPAWGPTLLTVREVTSSSVEVDWSLGATDDSAVYYRVHLDGSEIAMTTGTSIVIGGLDASTAYDLHVDAIDAAGNESVDLGPVTATTLAPGQYSLTPYDWKTNPDFQIEDLPTATAQQAYLDFQYGLDNPADNFRQSPGVYFAAMGANSGSNGSYSYGRNGGHWISSITEAIRTTGDPALVDELLIWSSQLKSNLQDHDGRGYDYFQYRGPGGVNPQHFATDTNLLDEQLLAGVIARMAWTLHENRHVVATAGSDADFWFDYLDQNWIPKWQARATRLTGSPYVPPVGLGLQNAVGWTSPDNPQHDDLGFNWAGGHSFNDVPGVSHGFPVRQIMHAYIASIYQYKVLGDYFAETGRPSVFGAAAYSDEAVARHDYWHAKTFIGSDGSRQIPHLIRDGIDSSDTDSYVRHLALYATEMHWMGFGNFASEQEMGAYAKIFYNPAAPDDDVYDAGNSTTMTKFIDATGSDHFAMTFNSLWTLWDPSGEIMNLNHAAITSVEHHKILGVTNKRHGSHYNGIMSFELYNAP